jgi:hypothetical protein
MHASARRGDQMMELEPNPVGTVRWLYLNRRNGCEHYFYGDEPPSKLPTIKVRIVRITTRHVVEETVRNNMLWSENGRTSYLLRRPPGRGWYVADRHRGAWRATTRWRRYLVKSTENLYDATRAIFIPWMPGLVLEKY